MKRKYAILIYLLIYICILLTACKTQESGNFSGASTEECTVFAADFYDMRIPVPASQLGTYTLGEKHLYVVRNVFEDKIPQIHVFKSKVGGKFDQDAFLVRPTASVYCILADLKDNIYLYLEDIGDNSFYLEKYDTDGNLIWSTQSPVQELTEGIIATDGSLYLMDYDGANSGIACFDKSGEFQKMYYPKAPVLRGLAEGSEQKVYAWSMKDEKVILEELESGRQESCPINATWVQGGQKKGIFLCTEEGLWNFQPQTRETQLLWRWNDEYININSNDIDYITSTKEGLCLICWDHGDEDWIIPLETEGPREISLVFIQEKNSSDCLGKQTITLGSLPVNGMISTNSSSSLKEIVRCYNRQSNKYQVEIVTYPSEDTASAVEMIGQLEKLFLDGEAPDIMSLAHIHAGELAKKGAFEDLTKYYETSQRVSQEDVLDSVWENCYFHDQNILVMPYFSIGTLFSREQIDPQEWTPWLFFELAEENVMFGYDNTEIALMMNSMGVDPTSHFINYENKTCDFDGQEFRDTLFSSKGLVRAYQSQNLTQDFSEGEYYLFTGTIGNTHNYLMAKQTLGQDICAVGYPSFRGAEYSMHPGEVFAMNRFSENKEGAWDFLEYLLSYEYQSHIISCFPVSLFPVRKDCFREYVRNSYYIEETDDGVFHNYIKGPQASEEDFILLEQMAENMVYHMWGCNKNVIENIIKEEAQMYFSGDAGLDETVGKIQNRVKLYLEE